MRNLKNLGHLVVCAKHSFTRLLLVGNHIFNFLLSCVSKLKKPNKT